MRFGCTAVTTFIAGDALKVVNMEEMDFRHVKRAELVEIIYRLQEEEDKLRTENASLKKELEKRELDIAEAGSIAEAALGLNGVFDAAQSAADQYLTEVKRLRDEAGAAALKLLEEARTQAARTVAEAEQQRDAMLAEAEQETDRRWREFDSKVQRTLEANSELRSLMAAFSEDRQK